MIVITQTCDSCLEKRTLELRGPNGPKDLEQAARSEGWRDVRDNKHLCKTCINDLVK